MGRITTFIPWATHQSQDAHVEPLTDQRRLNQGDFSKVIPLSLPGWEMAPVSFFKRWGGPEREGSILSTSFDFSIGEMIHQSCMIILMFSLDEWIVSPEQACVWLIGSVTATSVRYSQSEGITTIPKGPKPQPRKDLTMSCHFIHLNININMIIYIYCIYIHVYVYYAYVCIYIYKWRSKVQLPPNIHPEAELRTLPPQLARWAANPFNKVTLPTVDS